MPRNRLGQLLSFAIEIDADQRYSNYIWVDVRKGDTVAKVAARHGHPEDARTIADLNGIRSVTSKFSGRGLKRIRVPGTLRKSGSFDVLAGNDSLTITDGYAMFDTITRPGRTGLTQFTGYSPIVMDVPIWFEATSVSAGGVREGEDIERDIVLLERMAGRGDFPGSSVGPPPVIRVSATDAAGKPVPLIPHNYQWSPQNPLAPLWRVAGIDWDASPWRNPAGNRIRQLATVTLQQHVRINLVGRSAAERSRSKGRKTELMGRKLGTSKAIT